MESIEMLKALYDFQAVYPKTISFEEGEYFILYQTSARQRNWWQVVSMKGNIGFVPSNYVTKIKVEPDFLISFLDSSIESLEKSKEVEINGIMPKDELLERLCEKKNAMEKMYLENSERDADADSSWSFSQSIDENKYSKVQYQQSQQTKQSSRRLDSCKKSQSSPMVGVVVPHIITDSLSSMDSMHLQQTQSAMDLSLSLPTTKTSDAIITETTTTTITLTPTCSTTPTTTTVTSVSPSAIVAAATTTNPLQSTVTTQQQQQQLTNKVVAVQQQQQQPQLEHGSGGQDNSITSEPSEPTTTTTTSEDVVTTFKDLTFNRQSLSHSLHTSPPQNDDGEVGIDAVGGEGEVDGAGGGGGTIAEISEQMLDEKAEAEKSSDASEAPSVARDDIELAVNSADISPGLDSESSSMRAQLQAAAAAALAATTASYPRPNLSVESSDVYQIVDVIRRSTNLSFDMSCEALRVVLTSLEQLYNGAINPYLEAVAVHVTDRVDTPKELLGITHDAKRLQYIFTQLADCKNDSEQRTWMLYEDEDDILQFLDELVEILNNADENISCYEMSCDQYQVLTNLVQYYQMETRWPIKNLLLKTFTAACHLDHVIVDILLTSVLPLEIVEDMKTHFSNLDRFKQLVKMLTVIFSLGQPMPVNHQDYLGVHFASFLLEIVEGNNPENLVDLVISLILAFNMQFTECSENVVIEAMQALPTAKVFTEKILLLLNREEDPTRLLKHANSNMNSVLKIFIDIFSNSETAGMFYTNDNKVLIDILVRQLSDLCAGNSMRRSYLELCRRILRNTNYPEHQHRKQDLMKIFTRIFCEETECSASDQKLVREIANEFPQLFKA